MKFETISELFEYHLGAGAVPLCLRVTGDVRFGEWPASRNNKHHCRVGGLAEHTFDVLQRVACMAEAPGPAVDKLVLFTAAVWHDVGKLEEYDCKFEDPPYGRVIRTCARSDRGKLQSHIMLGLEKWAQLRLVMPAAPMSALRADHVAHCIGAHHGRKEWGSPLEPLTLEAMMLHHADMQSVMADVNLNPESR